MAQDHWRRWVGIDIGLSGGIAVLDFPAAGGAPTVAAHDMPVLRSKRKTSKGNGVVDVAGLARLLDAIHGVTLLDGRPVRVGYEEVASMPDQGVASMFSFGRALGAVEGALAASRLPVLPVRPAQWKRAMRVPAAKDGTVARADQLLPGAAHLWRGPRGGLLDGRAEAALIALYARQAWDAA